MRKVVREKVTGNSYGIRRMILGLCMEDSFIKTGVERFMCKELYDEK